MKSEDYSFKGILFCPLSTQSSFSTHTFALRFCAWNLTNFDRKRFLAGNILWSEMCFSEFVLRLFFLFSPTKKFCSLLMCRLMTDMSSKFLIVQGYIFLKSANFPKILSVTTPYPLFAFNQKNDVWYLKKSKS